MTVCAAAICMAWNENVLVGLSDRMITSGDIEFEPAASKIFTIEPLPIWCMAAGDTEASLEIATETESQARTRGLTEVRDVADLYAEAHAALRRKRLEQTYLSPYGLDVPAFLAAQRNMDPAVVADLHNKFTGTEGDLNTQALVVGVDATGPHIYLVSDPGRSACRDKVGFCSIGLGAQQFETMFMAAGFDTMWSLPNTLLLMMTAKKHAEMATGVGKLTDLFVMRPGAAPCYCWDEGPTRGVMGSPLLAVLKRYRDEFERRQSDLRAQILERMEMDEMLADLYSPTPTPGPATEEQDPATPEQQTDKPD